MDVSEEMLKNECLLCKFTKSITLRTLNNKNCNIAVKVTSEEQKMRNMTELSKPTYNPIHKITED